MIGLVLAGALFSMIGCGGGDSTVGNDEYNQQLRLVCNKGLQEREELVNAINKDYEENQEQKATTAYQIENLRKLIAVYQGTTEGIADIGLPEERAARAEEMVEAREDAAAKVDGDPLGTRDSLEAVFKKANQLASDLDAPSCAF